MKPHLEGVMVPSLKEWAVSARIFRDVMKQAYKVEGASWRNDVQFCRVMGINRSHFSRVIAGKDRPSPKILAALRAAFSETYEVCAGKWREHAHYDTVEDFANAIWHRMTQDMPGTLYVLTFGLLDKSEELLQGIASFLEADNQNELVFVLPRFNEEWGGWYLNSGLTSQEWVHPPTVGRFSMHLYLSSLLSRLRQTSSPETILSRVRAYSLPFPGTSANPSSQELRFTARLSSIAAWQLLHPNVVSMLYVGQNEAPFAYYFLQIGENQTWIPASDKDTGLLTVYVSRVLDLAKECPEEVKVLPGPSLLAIGSLLSKQ